MSVPSRSLALLLALPTAAQEPVELPAPFSAASGPNHPDEVALVLDEDLHAALAREARVIVRDFPLPASTVVDLELERCAWRGAVGVPHVDGVERMDLFLGMDLSTWKGSVVGDPGSRVYLGFSRHGSSGFLRTGGKIFLLEGRTSADGRRDQGHAAVVEAGARGVGGFTCGTDPAPSTPAAETPWAGRGSSLQALATSAQHARQAVSVDYWLYLNFGSDLNAELAYVYQLLWSVTEFYYDELAHPVLDFVYTVPYVELWTTPNDPWDAPDAGGDVTDEVLDEFEEKWDTIFDDEKVHMALLLSGMSIGGGKASGAGIDAEICPGDFAVLGEHSVCGGIDGQVGFPVVQDTDNWDFFVIAHEVGHNLGGIHTHEMGIDDCDEGDPGNCPEGTIMSYCHACDDVGNIDISFHPANKDNIWWKLDGQDCLPLIGVEPIHVRSPVGHSSFPNGTPVHPYSSFFEGVRLAALLGGPAGAVRVEGTLPGGLAGAQSWPAMLLGEPMLAGSSVIVEGWLLGNGATIGD